MTLFDSLKNILVVLIFLHLAPTLVQGIFKQYSRHFEPRTAVGLLTIKGTLYDSSYYTKQLHRFFKNNDIKALLIKMDCSGSASGTGYAIYHELKTLRAAYNKPVVVLVENVCASGGYWIACGTDHIIATETALIGNIGAALPYLFQIGGLLAQHHIKYEQVKAGTYKTVGDPFTDSITPEEKQMLQTVVDDSYAHFTQAIAKERKLSLADSKQWADGKLFTGAQALKMGMIDQVGSVSTAIAALKEKALIEGEIEWVKPPVRSGLLAMLRGSADRSVGDDVMTNMLNLLSKSLINRHETAPLQ